MRKDKRGLIFTLGFFARVILFVVVLVLVIFPACNRSLAYFHGVKETEYFEDFVKKVRNLDKGEDVGFLVLESGSAVIGFSKGAGEYYYEESNRATIAGGKPRKGTTIKKFTNEECKDGACICYCSQDYESIRKEGSCKKPKCFALAGIDIVNKSLYLFNQFTQPDKIIHNINGFLITRPKDQSNKRMAIWIEKRVIGDKKLLGICTSQVKGAFGDRCIVTQFEEAKEFERLAKNNKWISPNGLERTLPKQVMYDNALHKYNEFINRYKTGIEVEESYYRVGEIYYTLFKNTKKIDYVITEADRKSDSKLKKAIEAYETIRDKFPQSEFSVDAQSRLNEIKDVEGWYI